MKTLVESNGKQAESNMNDRVHEYQPHHAATADDEGEFETITMSSPANMVTTQQALVMATPI